MAHNIETMAYTNEKPWHGLGFKVDNKQSVPQMLKAAKLDWKVEKHPLFTAKEKSYSPDDYQAIEDRYALVRDSDNRVLDIAGAAYKPHQNAEIFEFFKEYVEAGDAYMETAGSLRNGGLVWGLANLNSSFKLKGEDEVKGYLLVMAPHIVGKSSIAKLTTVRVVCNNTLDLAMKGQGSEFRMPHRSEMNDSLIKKAKEHLGIARETVAEFKDTAIKLQKLKLKKPEIIEILAPIYQPNAAVEDLRRDFDTEAAPRMKQLMDILERAPGAQPDNGWGVLNAVTYYADHVASRTPDKRLANAWLGKTANQKQQVLKTLLAA